MTTHYLMVEKINTYRWVGPTQDGTDWGLWLARVRDDPVAAEWVPVPIEWLPETEGREICDFPIFRTTVRCISKKAVAKLEPMLRNAGELLELVGLNGRYVGYHCLRKIDALDTTALTEHLAENKYASLHSANFVPVLRRSAVEESGADVFRIPEAVGKIFVSQKFKEIYEVERFTGLDFLTVPLCRSEN